MTKPKISSDGRTITVRLPISLRRRGGHKLVLVPDRAEAAPGPMVRHVDNAPIKAIAGASRWRDMLENGDYSTIREAATAEKINEPYVGRVLGLTLLAPELVEAIIDGRQSPDITLAQLMAPFPAIWEHQWE